MTDNGKVLRFPGAKESAEPANFKMFLEHIVANRMQQAAEALEQIMGIDAVVARDAASFFQARYVASESIVMKAMEIRQLIQQKRNVEALHLIYECFGIQGPEALVAFQSLSKLV